LHTCFRQRRTGARTATVWFEPWAWEDLVTPRIKLGNTRTIVLLTKTGPRCISFRCKVTVSLAQGAVNDAEADVADPVFVRSTINKIPLPWRSIGRLLKESVSSRPIKRRYHAGLQPTLDCLRACPACKPSISAMTTVGSRDAQSTEWLKQLREHRGQAALAKSDLLGEVRGRA